MKKLTNILTLYYTTNFQDEGNATGSVIDFSTDALFQLQPAASLTERITSLKGLTVTDEHSTSLYLPFTFFEAPYDSPAPLLPAQLLFYIVPLNIAKTRYSGLALDGRFLSVQPRPGLVSYRFLHKSKSCHPCGSADILSTADLVPALPAGIPYPPGAIGLVSIPTASLDLHNHPQEDYEDLNNFILHFPAARPAIALTLNLPQFDPATTTLSIDARQILATVTDHPTMPGYKKVTGQLAGYDLFLDKSKQVITQTGDKKSYTPIDPMNSYDLATNTSTISITK